MPLITVVQTIITTFEVPEGHSIEHLRYLVNDPILDSNVEEDVRTVHRKALTDAYDGKFVDEHGQAGRLQVYEGPYRRE